MSWVHRMRHWLAADRVRISPQAGQWLTLQVGQRVIWNDRLWKIDDRQVVDVNRRLGVSYHLVELVDDLPLSQREVPPVLCDDAAVAVIPLLKHTIRIDCFCEYD